MAFQLSPGDAVEMSVRGHVDEQEVDNVFHFYIGTDGGSTYPVQLGSTFLLLQFIAEFYRNNILDKMAPGYTVDQYIARKIQLPFPGGTPKWNFSAVDVVLGDPALDISNGLTTPALPTYASVNMWYRATPSGRSGKGRKGFAQVQEAHTNNDAGMGSNLTDQGLSVWQAVADNLDNTLICGIPPASFAARPVLGSLKSYLAFLTDPEIFRTLVGITVRRPLGTQLSRKRRVRFA